MCKCMDTFFTFFVGFAKSDLWYKHFLKPGFGHCSVLLPCQDCWLEIDPTGIILQLHILSDVEVAHFTKLLRVTVKANKFKGFPLKFLTCVTIVEYMLGRNLHSITPYRLYKKLTRVFKDFFQTHEII